MSTLNDDDVRTIIEFLHEEEHASNSCPFSERGLSTSCPAYRRAAVVADRGLLAAVDAIVSSKLQGELF